MSVVLSSTLASGEGLFNRFAKAALLVADVDALRGSTTDADVLAVYQQYPTNDQGAITNLYPQRDQFRTAPSTWVGQIATMMQQTAAAQVNRDTPLAAVTYQAALPVLVRQMLAGSASITRPTVTATPTPNGTNTGDAVLVASVVDGDGYQLDYVNPETVTVTVASDSGTGATAYQEPVSISGAPTRSPTDYNWPGGGGVTSTAQVTNAAQTTKVANGDFEDWTANVPDSWTLVTGTPGSTIAEGSDPLRGSHDLQLTSDGAEQTRIRQAVSLDPNTVYSVNCWAKISSAAAGTLVVKLVNAAGTTITDDQSTANSLSIDTNALTTSYAAKNAFFRTPKVLPAAVYLDVHLTSPPTSGRVIALDLLGLAQASSHYAGGPWVALWSGGTASAKGDYWTLALANNLMAGTKFVRYLDRWFNLKQLGLKVPSSASPTLPDPA
jgi:hypothetical protein